MCLSVVLLQIESFYHRLLTVDQTEIGLVIFRQSVNKMNSKVDFTQKESHKQVFDIKEIT